METLNKLYSNITNKRTEKTNDFHKHEQVIKENLMNVLNILELTKAKQFTIEHSRWSEDVQDILIYSTIE